MTSLANNFCMQKSLFKNIFGHLMFICERIFKIFAAHFRTKGMLNHGKIILYEDESQRGDTRKTSF